ncbi:MbnP family protein [Chitinophaga sp. GCM10012297]|uniref:Copper-binding protein MbnP-like domain-containing protein n=1 Tax=Chitinophaga chungangae TaxID=2821488 RepID=A0ABS3YL05_9BACT|nr:MbnP family protein [Chitinophaga chungangae]MBO9155376.1 hypothetical protein [Chitinophaga chungangae]
MKPYYLLPLLFLFCIACKKDKQEQKGNIQINFKNVVNGVPLTLNTANYTNANGETFTVTTFKYYISNISLVKMDNSTLRIPDTYFLVDESTAASKNISFQAPVGEYRGISFKIGVDSTRNVSGAQTGALDPVNGMFWSWNSGYIMAKMEGASPASAAADKTLTFHIGGFKGNFNAVQNVDLVSPISLNVGLQRHPQLTLTADLYNWFTGINLIRFSDNATVHVPGELAWKISMNYRTMFRITDVTDL